MVTDDEPSLVPRRHLPQERDGALAIPRPHTAPEELELAAEVGGAEAVILDHEDLLVRCRQKLLVRHHELFPEPLARPETHHFHRHVASRLHARQADQILGKVRNPDWLTHVEEEYLAALADRPRLEHALGPL